MNESKILNKEWIYALLLIPIASSFLALQHFGFVFKSGSAGSGILILLVLYFKKIHLKKDILMLIAAFAFSIIGDWFLSNKKDDANMFIYGIGFFLLAHIGYLLYSLNNGKVKWLFTSILLLAFLVFFVLAIYPAVDNYILLLAVLVYLVISCLSLGAAAEIQAPGVEKWVYVFGIFLILFSDTIIALKEFAG